MSSTFGGLNTVVSGMAAQQLSINTTGNNVANANTVGYSRQTVNLVTTTPEQIYTANGMSMLGTGVNTASITRARDFLVDCQYWQQNSTKNFYSAQTDVLSKVENVFNDSKGTGIQNALNLFQTALGTLANNPGEVSTRTTAREDANTLVETLQTAGNTLVTEANDISKQIDTQVTQVNSYTSQIANLNKQIVTQEAAGATANDLRDSRDLLIDKLSALTQVTVSEDKSGAYTVLIAGGGVPLVQGSTSTELTVQHTKNSPYGYDETSVSTAIGGINVTFKNGSIASLTQLRDTTVNGYLGNLDNMAKSLLQDFNMQHKAGFDNETPPVAGDNFFGESFTGSTSTTNDYATGGANDPTVGASPASWLSILKVNDDFYTTGGLDKIAAGSTKTSGSADGSNATILANWLTATPTSTSESLGNNSLNDYYSSIVSAVGVQSQKATNISANQTTIFSAISTTRDSISGVSMDEELANMIKFQQGYGACAKVLTTMNSMLDTLVNSMAS